MGFFDKNSTSTTTLNDHSIDDNSLVNNAEDVKIGVATPIETNLDAGNATVGGYGDNEVSIDYSTTVIDGGAFDLAGNTTASAFSFLEDFSDNLLGGFSDKLFSQTAGVIEGVQDFTTTQANSFESSLSKINQNMTAALTGGNSEIMKTVMVVMGLVMVFFFLTVRKG